MAGRHILLALFVAILWGTNFTVSKFCLQCVPPFAMCFWRFIFLLPLVFFVKKPPRKLFLLVVFYGLVLGLIKLTLMFFSLHLGMPAGLGAVIIQSQIVFTVILSIFILGYRSTKRQTLGILICVIGMVLLCAVEQGTSFTAISFILVMMAAFFWGIANIILKKLADVPPITIVAWIAPVTLLPVFVSNIIFEDSNGIINFFEFATPPLIMGALYISFASTLLGTISWAYLISRYSPDVICVYAILIPVVSMIEGVIFLGETISATAYTATSVILFGLYINQTKSNRKPTSLKLS